MKTNFSIEGQAVSSLSKDLYLIELYDEFFHVLEVILFSSSTANSLPADIFALHLRDKNPDVYGYRLTYISPYVESFRRNLNSEKHFLKSYDVVYFDEQDNIVDNERVSECINFADVILRSATFLNVTKASDPSYYRCRIYKNGVVKKTIKKLNLESDK